MLEKNFIIEKIDQIYNLKMLDIIHFEEFFLENKNVITEIENLINILEKGIKNYGNKFVDFKGNNKLKISVFSAFNIKLRNIRKEWIEVDIKRMKIDKFLKKYIEKKFSIEDNEEYLFELYEILDILKLINENKEIFVEYMQEKYKNKTLIKVM